MKRQKKKTFKKRIRVEYNERKNKEGKKGGGKKDSKIVRVKCELYIC